MKRLLNNRSVYRALALVLVLGLLVTSLPPAMSDRIHAEVKTVAYSPKKQEYGVLNKFSSANSPFYSAFVKAASDFNFAPAFGLDFHTSYVRPRKNITLYMGYDPDTHQPSYPVLNSLRMAGDLAVNYRATLYNHLHFSFDHVGPEKVLAYQHTHLIQAYSELFGYNSWDQRTTSFTDYGDGLGHGDYKMLKSAYDGTFFKLGMYTDGCSICGDAATSHISIAFADMAGPQILSAKITGGIVNADGKIVDSGIADTTFKANDAVFIHVNFDEYIRFADNANTHGDVRLKLKLANLANDQEVEGLEAYADLVSLKDMTLSFLYTVPETVSTSGTASPVNTNHKIIGIAGLIAPNPADPSASVSILSGGSWPMKILGSNGRELITSVQDPSISTLSVADRQTLLTSSSLITDLAGNPCEPQAGLPGISNPARLDTTPPAVYAVQVEASNASVNNRVGSGSQLTFSVQFTEPLNLPDTEVKNIKATLNLLDSLTGTDVPVQITAAIKMDESLGVNGPLATRITFSPLTITETMKPLLYSADKFLRVAIERITFTDGTDFGVTDLCGNALTPATGLASSDKRILPNAAYYLDFEGPVVSTTLIAANDLYTPLRDGTGDDHTSVSVSFKVTDTSSLSLDYVSGINTSPLLLGSFSLFDPDDPGRVFMFEYVVTNQADLTGSEEFAAGTTGSNVAYAFQEISTTGTQDDLYLHIRLLDSVAYYLVNPVLRVHAVDLVGNASEFSFRLDYVADRIIPVCQQIGFTSSYDSGTGTGSITAQLQLTDPSKIDIANILYQWVALGEDPDPLEWLTYDNAGVSAVSVPLTLVKDNLASGTNHAYDLYIRASDLSTPANDGTYGPFSYARDLSFPAINVTYSEEIQGKPAFTISSPEVTGTTTNGATAVVMIRDPLGDGSQYFIRTIDSNMLPNASSDGLTGFHPDILSDAAAERILSTSIGNYWRYATVLKDTTSTPKNSTQPIEMAYHFMDDRDVVIGDETSAIANRLLAIMNGQYYGSLDMTILSATGVTGVRDGLTIMPSGIYDLNALNDGNCYLEAGYYRLSDNKFFYDADCTHELDYQQGNKNNFRKISYIPNSAVVNTQTWTLRAAGSKTALTESGSIQPAEVNSAFPHLLDNTNPPIHQATITPHSPSTLEPDWYAYTSPDDGPIIATSIDNLEFRIDLANVILPSWSLDDIDFSSPDTYAALYC